jgi:hypothetical protein
MQKRLLFNLAGIIVYSQEYRGKFSTGATIGTQTVYNNMLYPYTFRGNNYGLNFDWQGLHDKQWLSNVQMGLHYAPLYTSNSAINIKSFNTVQYMLGFELQVQQMKKITALSNDQFSLFAGGHLGARVNYQVVADMAANIAYTFNPLDVSMGISLHAEYKWGKASLSNNFQLLLLAGTFYPQYGNNNPFTSVGTAVDYFLFTTIGTLNRCSNLLKAEFPVFINKKQWHTFFVGYHLTYEYSTLRDNPYWDITHALCLGIVFRISKLGY